MSMEHLRKRARGLVADATGDPGNPLVARFEKKRSLRHAAFDQIPIHGLPSELGEARRKRRAAEPHPLSEVAKGPGPVRPIMDQLKRRTYVRVRHRPQPSALSGSKRLHPASQ